MNQTSGLRYSYTNEDLRGIILGLDFSPEDSVLAVAGSGDQAFAFLEFTRQVKAVDIVPEQIELMRQKAEALRIGDYDEFFKVEATGSYDGNLSGSHSPEFSEFNRHRRRMYFAEDDPQRLERVRANLDNLVIAEPADILKVAQTESGFSKIYLSNVLGYGDGISYANATEILGNIARNLPIDGLIYVANHERISDRFKPSIVLRGGIENKIGNSMDLYDMLDKDKDLRESSFLPPELEVDRALSKAARTYDKGIWKPAVYRRVEPKTPLTF